MRSKRCILDRLVFIPAAVSRSRRSRYGIHGDRLTMLRLSLEHDPRFAVDAIEIDRGGLSYTVDTLAALGRARPGGRAIPLIGEDLAEQIATWLERGALPSLATIVVLARERRRGRRRAGRPAMPSVRIATRRVDVSSTEIRARGCGPGKNIRDS